MKPSAPITLSHGVVSATVLPAEGAALVELTINDRPVLARMPWAPAPIPRPSVAVTEADWVARWRGGWQLCFPSAGQPDSSAVPTQGFHGAASQASWSVLGHSAASARLRWSDGHGLRATRTWSLTDDGATVTTVAENHSPLPQAVSIAEHLILGGDVLAGELELGIPVGTGLQPLDYAGLPLGDPVPWPGEPSDEWSRLSEKTPARVAGLVSPNPKTINVSGRHVSATVTWAGDALPHALLWEELGVSTEHPWNGAVRALGIEPASASHGAGSGNPEGLVTIVAGQRVEWTASLAVQWAAGPERGGTL